MIKNRFTLIALVFGLSILPSIIDGSHFPDHPGNDTLMDLFLPKSQDHKLNATETANRQQQKIISRKKFARKVQQLTIPFIDTIDSLPKYLRALGEGTVDTNSTQMTSNNKTDLILTYNQRQENKPKLYAKLFRVLVQHAWNDAWESVKGKKIESR